MTTNKAHITVFEHESIKLNQVINDCLFDEYKLAALEKYYGDKGVPYYSLINNGVRFNEFVGVIQVGNLLIEVLPKADKNTHSKNEETKWRKILIDMMRAVGSFDIRVTSNSQLKIKPNTILDLYIEMFINEIEYLLHTGLVKKYRKIEGNVTALKGNLLFSKHIQQNLTHRERFFVQHTTFDYEHQLHFILFTTIRLINQVNTSVSLQSRISALLLFFPEMQTAKVSEATFNKLVFNRKTECYKKVIEIAKLLLLQYHPDVSRGRNNVLALMFDMNLLWEQFVYVSLRKFSTKFTISAQTTKYFWQPENGFSSKIRPDIVINKDLNDCIVLDTKWKNLNGYNPSADDLRQMYVYHEYFNAKKVALVYPAVENENHIKGNYYHIDNKGLNTEKECSILPILVNNNVKEWQRKICENFENWIE